MCLEYVKKGTGFYTFDSLPKNTYCITILFSFNFNIIIHLKKKLIFIAVGRRDLEVHLKTTKHENNVQTASTTISMKKFTYNKSTPEALAVWAAEGIMAFHTVRHHQSYRSMDCTSQLMRKLFSDSKVGKNISCARTKVEAIVNGVLSGHSIETILQDLKNIPFFSIGTDSSNHGSLKMFPLIVQFFDPDKGGIVVRLLNVKETKNETSETIATMITEELDKHDGQNLRKKLIALGGDNINTNFGGLKRKEGNNVFTHLRKEVNEHLVGIGCPGHILHNSVHHGLDRFGSFDIESIVGKILKHFSIYTVRTNELKGFCDFVEIEYRVLLSHVITRWLSLAPCIDRILQLFPALQSYFKSIDQPPVVLERFFNDDFAELQLLFISSFMTIFHDNIKKVEREENSVLEVLNVIDEISEILSNRFDSKFIPFIVKQKLKTLENEGKETECNKFIESMLSVYQQSNQYLLKWSESLRILKNFEWLDFKPGKKLNYESMERTVEFLASKNIVIDDSKLFNQFVNLKNFLASKDSKDEFFNKCSSAKMCDFLSQNNCLETCSEIVKIAQYFFAIPSHNANCERVFSFVNIQWTDERSKFLFENLKNLILVQYNFRKFDCLQFHSYLEKNPALLRKIGSGEKY